MPASSGSAATARSPAARAAALLMPLARPARPGSTEDRTVAVSGATRAAMPRPITSSAGSTSRTYGAPGPTRSISSIPAAHSSGPKVSGIRGPIRSPSCAERADSSSIRAVVGSRAAPAPRAEYPDTTWSWSTTRKKKPPKAAYTHRVTRLTAVNRREEKMSGGTIGSARRRSTTTKAPASSTPPTAAPTTGAAPDRASMSA